MPPPDSQAASPPDEAPYPPRFWWLKRLGVAALVLVVLFAAVRWWWGVEAQRRLDAMIDELHAQGQRVLLRDFATEPVPPEENAATLLLEAARKLSLAQAPVPLDDLAAHPEIIAARADDVQRLTDANAEALALVRQARGRKKVDWGVVLKSPVTSVLLPQLSPQRDLERLVCSHAVLAAAKGQRLEAVESLRDGLSLSRAVQQANPFLIAALVGNAQSDLVCSAAETVLTQLGSSATTTQPVRPIEPELRNSLLHLRDELLDEQPARGGWFAAFEGERLMYLDTIEFSRSRGFGPALGYISGGGIGIPSAAERAVWPMFVLDLVKAMDDVTQYQSAGLAPALAEARDLLPGEFPHGLDPRGLARLGSRLLLPSLGGAVDLQFRHLAHRRLAATAIALRLYELEHGKAVESLDVLVPEYLSEIPRDPLTDDGALIRLVSDASGRRLYSVGRDGVDQGGWYRPPPTGTVLPGPHFGTDEVFYLDGPRPRIPYPTTSGPTADQEAASLEAEVDQTPPEHQAREPDQAGQQDDQP